MKDRYPENISLADFLMWEQTQTERHEWVDGLVVPCAGVSFEHGTIGINLIASFRAVVGNGPCFVQPSDRQLVPRDVNDVDLGSFYADLFVSCEARDRVGSAAHFPTVVVEVLPDHIGGEFTRKQRAYLASAKIGDYLIVESATRFVHRFSWKVEDGRRRLVMCQHRRGPVPVSALGLNLSFDEIYAGTTVPALVHAVNPADETESEILHD